MTLRVIGRNVLRAPGFATLVVVTLAVGIGATTAMYSLVDAVLLRPLRFAGADRAVAIWTRTSEGTSAQPGLSPGAFADVQHALADVAHVEGYRFGSGTITGGAEPVIVSIPAVMPGILRLVGASVVLGRLLTLDDAAPGAEAVVISEALWESQFGRDPAAVGRRLAIDGQPHTVVGVLSDRVQYPERRTMIWKAFDVTTASQERARVQALVIRHPEVPLEALRARLAAVTLSLRAQGTLPTGHSLLFDDVVQQRMARNQGRPLWLMFGAVGLVLFIACGNVMNLMLLRASTRRSEFAVLSAIGASRFALVRLVGTEVALLTALGLTGGVAIAALLVHAIPVVVPVQLSFLTSTTADLNWRVLAFASGLAGLTSVLAGLVPIWRSSRIQPGDVMKWQSPSVAGARDERWQGSMLAVQLGVVIVLVGGTGALLRQFVALTNTDPGYDAAALVATSVQMTAPRYSDATVALRVMQDLEARVEAAGLGPATFTSGTPIYFEMRPEGEGARTVDATGMVLPWTRVSSDYFETMGIPVLQGRTFALDDSPEAIVVNDRLARAFWGDQSPIGRRLRFDRDEPWRTVVGVVGDVRMMGLDDPTKHGMEFYTLHSQTRAASGFELVVRSPLQPAVVVARVKELLWSVDPGVPVVEAGSMRDQLLESLYRQRFVVRLSSAFAATSMLLAGVGLYGVAASWVARRRRELAIRVAIGATGRQVVQRLLLPAAAVGTAGSALGIAGSLASVRLAQWSLGDTGTADLLVLCGTVGILVVLIALTCVGPTRTALSTDPAILLREQ